LVRAGNVLNLICREGIAVAAGQSLMVLEES